MFEETDTNLLLLINGAHTPFLDQLMWVVSERLVWVPFYLVTLFVIWRNNGWRGVFELLVLVGMMMLMTDAFNSQVIRPWIHRLRPCHPDNPISGMVHLVREHRSMSCSCPSAHAANFCGLSLLIAYFIRSRRVLCYMLAFTLLVCYSRAYMGLHYPGDLLAGMLYATLVVGALLFVYRRWRRPCFEQRSRMEWIPGLALLVTLSVMAVWALLTI